MRAEMMKIEAEYQEEKLMIEEQIPGGNCTRLENFRGEILQLIKPVFQFFFFLKESRWSTRVTVSEGERDERFQQGCQNDTIN